MKRSIIIFVAAIFIAACQPSAPSFDAALETHLEAIQSRDLGVYKTTITKGETLPLIFPDGSFLGTREEVVAFHDGWFKNKDWLMDFEEVSKVVGSDMATVLFKTSYRDNQAGLPRYAYLALVFQLQDGEWRLVHDQNTRID